MKNILRTLEPKNFEKLRTAQLEPKFTGSYKKSVYVQIEGFSKLPTFGINYSKNFLDFCQEFAEFDFVAWIYLQKFRKSNCLLTKSRCCDFYQITCLMIPISYRKDNFKTFVQTYSTFD